MTAPADIETAIEVALVRVTRELAQIETVLDRAACELAQIAETAARIKSLVQIIASASGAAP